jgi:hypothetical protein
VVAKQGFGYLEMVDRIDLEGIERLGCIVGSVLPTSV